MVVVVRLGCRFYERFEVIDESLGALLLSFSSTFFGFFLSNWLELATKRCEMTSDDGRTTQGAILKVLGKAPGTAAM